MDSPKLAALDWNGTTLNDRNSAWRGIKAIFNHYQIQAPQADNFFDSSQPDYLPVYHQHGIPKHASKDDLNKIWQRHYGDYTSDGQLREGVIELLEFLKNLGIKTAIISAEFGPVLEKRLNQLELRELLDLAWGDCLDKSLALAKAANELGIPAAKVIYVDDNYHGLIQAKATKVITVGFTGGWQSPSKISQANPDFLASNFYEVRQVVETLRNLQEQGAT
ncbi:MAG: Uncharacterized protein G01um101420_99 [Parcubacteria group bacterium Gr01-1014_20]|nr:MAG: Uncharacterized protein G01um101420_99 [Parcubacteria group bacterium Gr01-1014_20]